MLYGRSPALPPEVIDLIVDNLHRDSSILRTCGLVSRDWLAASRHHLYSGVCLPRRNLNTFLDLIKSLFRLRGLLVVGFLHAEIVQLWPLLPALSYLHSLHIYGKLLSVDDGSLEMKRLPQLDTLSLSTAHFSSYHSFTRFLSQFPGLRTLKLENVSCVPLSENSPLPSLRLELSTLHVTLTAGILGWLKSTDFPLRSRCLELDIPTTDPIMSEYFEALATHPQELTLIFYAASQLAIFSEKPMLKFNTALRSIRITRALWISGESEVRAAPALGRLLMQLPSSCLEELIFDAALEYPGIVPSTASARDAAEILDGLAFAGLKRIEFYGPWDRVDDILGKQFRSAIVALLPLQSARGIVRIGAHRFE
ncbi:hypothetical protein B0H10DRAFT_2054367 [Mycena sp. CBHHK59/15]|nr:hypothetical protein B0H10DRAFT_2054367 [Mycena sp. CBHHK59/15]